MKQTPPLSGLKLAGSFGGLGFTIIILIVLGHYLDAQFNTGARWTIAAGILSGLILLGSVYSLFKTLLKNGR